MAAFRVGLLYAAIGKNVETDGHIAGDVHAAGELWIRGLTANQQGALRLGLCRARRRRGGREGRKGDECHKVTHFFSWDTEKVSALKGVTLV